MPSIKREAESQDEVEIVGSRCVAKRKVTRAPRPAAAVSQAPGPTQYMRSGGPMGYYRAPYRSPSRPVQIPVSRSPVPSPAPVARRVRVKQEQESPVEGSAQPSAADNIPSNIRPFSLLQEPVNMAGVMNVVEQSPADQEAEPSTREQQLEDQIRELEWQLHDERLWSKTSAARWERHSNMLIANQRELYQSYSAQQVRIRELERALERERGRCAHLQRQRDALLRSINYPQNRGPPQTPPSSSSSIGPDTPYPKYPVQAANNGPFMQASAHLPPYGPSREERDQAETRRALRMQYHGQRLPASSRPTGGLSRSGSVMPIRTAPAYYRQLAARDPDSTIPSIEVHEPQDRALTLEVEPKPEVLSEPEDYSDGWIDV
jgi:hypothetical protein